MSRLRFLAICGCLLLLLPARASSAHSVAADPLCNSLSGILPPSLKPSFLPHVQEDSVVIDDMELTLRVCAPSGQELTADRMLMLLKRALPILDQHAGLQIKGSNHRTIQLVQGEVLDQYQADGLYADGVIYLHPDSTTWTVVHEGAHYWADLQNFADRWLVEGYADYLTQYAMDQLGEPYTPRDIPTACVDQPLFDWDYEPPETSHCGYLVGSAVLHELADAVGEQQFLATMRLLDEQRAPITTWQLLRELERASRRDLTGIMKQRVFPPAEHARLDQRSALWQRLRPLEEHAAQLGVPLPPTIAQDIDDLRLDTADATLALVQPLLEAAAQLDQRCRDLSLACQQPWRALTSDLSQWPYVTAQLTSVQPLIERFASFKQRTQALSLGVPPQLTDALAGFTPAAEQQLNQARQLFSRGEALEQHCQQLAMSCSAYWRDDWNSGSLEAVDGTLRALTTLLAKAAPVDQRCADLVDACRRIWQTGLSKEGPAAAQQAVDQLDGLLQRGAALEQQCVKAGWPCAESWRAALRSGDPAQAHAQIDQSERLLAELQPIAQQIEGDTPRALTLLDRLWPSRERPDQRLAEARSAFYQGKLQDARSLARTAQSAQIDAAQRRPWVSALLATTLLLMLLLIALHGHARRMRRVKP